MSKRQLVERYHKLTGEEFSVDNPEIRKALRVNTLKISEEECVKALREKGVRLEKIPYLPEAYWYEADFPISSMTENLLGYFYIQEAASQIPPHILIDDEELKHIHEKKSRGEKILILDMAAAPGSKTTEIASITKDEIPIIALDSVAPRITILNNNLDRLGIRSVLTYKKDARYADDVEKQFDYILLDAPCSGNYCIERDFFTKRSVNDYQKQSQTQKELLRTAERILKKGGVLVYSTCSLEPEEDEEVVDWFLNEFENMICEEIDFPLGEEGYTEVFGKQLSKEVKKTIHFYPKKTKTQI